jgi:hypothetical protein
MEEMDGISEPAEMDEGPIKGVLAFGPVIRGYQYVPASPPLPCLSFQLWLRLWHYRYQNRQLHVSPGSSRTLPDPPPTFPLPTKPRELGTTSWLFLVSEFGFCFYFFIFVKSFGVFEKVEMIGGLAFYDVQGARKRLFGVGREII